MVKYWKRKGPPMNIPAMIQQQKTIYPAFYLPLKKGIIGIHANVATKKGLLQQLANEEGYIFKANEGNYERLTVRELLRFLCQLSTTKQHEKEWLKRYQLEEMKRMKVGSLAESERAFLKLLRIGFAEQELIIVEEPFLELMDVERQKGLQLFEDLRHKKIVLLSANLEDVLSCDEIYRLDETGLHSMDISDDEDEVIEAQSKPLVVEKIKTKKNDKIILFNPPEIDFIESIESVVHVHVAGESYVCQMTLTEMEAKLQTYGFYRCHRSYIVNLQKIREIITWTKNSYSLRLSTGKEAVVPLSRAKLQELKDLLHI